MRKRAYLVRPCFWPSSYVSSVKLVLYGFNVSRHFGLHHIPYYASRNPAFERHWIAFNGVKL